MQQRSHGLQIGRITGIGGAVWDNGYYKTILADSRVGLDTDKALVKDPETKLIVEEFANENGKFLKEFRNTYVKLTTLGTA
jgi:catalase (peroxidase I)